MHDIFCRLYVRCLLLGYCIIEDFMQVLISLMVLFWFVAYQHYFISDANSVYQVNPMIDFSDLYVHIICNYASRN